MLKIYELQAKGFLSTKTTNALMRGIWYRGDDDKFTEQYTDEKGFTYPRTKATVEELFNYYGEKGLRSFKSIGDKAINELVAARSIR